jgi:hypothetical protein
MATHHTLFVHLNLISWSVFVDPAPEFHQSGSNLGTCWHKQPNLIPDLCCGAIRSDFRTPA